MNLSKVLYRGSFLGAVFSGGGFWPLSNLKNCTPKTAPKAFFGKNQKTHLSGKVFTVQFLVGVVLEAVFEADWKKMHGLQ